jgi:hypothetical protein
MKSLNTLFTVLIAILMTAGSAFGQYVTVGTATGTSTTTEASPVNIFFRSTHYQTIYTVAELQAAGFTPGAAIQEMGWDVVGAPLYGMPNYTIAAGHTTNATSGAANYVASASLTQVYTNASYAPVAGGFDMLQLSTPFIWNGTDNLVIDVCFDLVNPGYNASGQCSTYNATDGSTSIRSDQANQCGLAPNSTQAWKPVVQFLIANGAPPTCAMINNDLTAANVTAYTAGLTWTHPGTPVSYIVEYGINGFTPGTGTVVTSTGSPALLTGLTPATVYSANVRTVCGTAVGDTSFASGITFTTPCATFIAPYVETFGSGAMPLCWTQSATIGGPWVFAGNPGYDAGGTQSHTADGSYYAWMDFSGADDDVILTMAEVDISGLSSAALSFWHFSYFTNASSANNELRIEASDGAGNWVLVGSIQQNAPDWQFKLYDLSTYVYNTSMVQIRFVADVDPAVGTYFYNDLLIDDVKIDVLPTSACAPVVAPDTTGFEDGGILNACWEQDSLDVLDWTILTGPTGSVGTGPNGASSGSFYAYLESSNPVASGDSAILISPPYNTAALADAPALHFKYHMFGNDSMILRVEYEVFGSGSWTSVWEQVGAVQEADTDPYADAYIPLPNAIGSIVRFRFIAVAQTNNGAVPGAGNAGASDIAIDDIRVQNVLANDIAITDIVTPGNDCGLGVQPVTIEVTNRGFNAQSNVPVFVSVNGGTAIGYFTGSIAANGGVGTINVLADMTMLGDYTIDAYAVLPGDEVTTNDAMQGSAYNQPAVVGEYNEEFEGSNGYWYATGDWEHGTPNDAVITGAGAGSEAYVTNLTGNYTDGNVSYLYTPCFDIATMALPRMRFSIYWDIEDDYDGAWLDYSVDGGATWSKLGTNNFSGQSWYTDSVSNSSLGWVWNGTGADGSGGWVDAIIDLQSFGFTGEVRFRFVMFSDVATSNAGLGIDNFGIFDGCIETVLNETVVGASADGLSDGSITLNPVAGFGGYTYNWSTGSTMSSITGLAPGTYDVTVTDQATCSNTASFTIVSLCPTSLGLSVTINPEIGDDENNGSAEIMVTGGTAPYTYSWSNGTTTSSAFNLGGDSLTVTVTDANGCTDMVDVTIETVYMVGTENLEGLTSLVLSPNPSKNYTQLNINFNESVDLTVRLIDVTGRVLETRNAGNTMTEEMRFDVSNFAQGVYFMQIIANGQTATQRFVVIK